jgi:hypothetical protein
MIKTLDAMPMSAEKSQQEFEKLFITASTRVESMRSA